ncbi:MAG: cation diffusion facilitator family transporter [Halothiobacillaceae bacterium]
MKNTTTSQRSGSGMTLEQRRAVMKRVTLTGMLVNLGLSSVQIAGGLLAHSQALLADGLHTLSDMISDGIVYLTAHHANARPDDDHPYGHRRYETLVSILVGLILLGVAFGISLEAAHMLLAAGTVAGPGPWALAVAVLAIVAKEGLYHYTIHVARRTRSRMLQANAWHHRSDALSSIIVLMGVAGATLFGLDYLDALAAILVSGMLALMGGRMIWNSLQEVMDTALDPDKVRAIGEVIRNVDGVDDFHQLRTRQMGGMALVDVHIQVAPKISVSEGDHIAESVRFHLIDQVPEVDDVTIHVDTEDDEGCDRGPCLELPSRRQLLARLAENWEHQLFPVDQIGVLGLHYVDGKIELDLSLPLRLFDDLPQARAGAEALRNFTETLPEIRRVAVYLR